MIAVDLWIWPLDVEAGERARLSAFLSADETERANRFVFVRDRERFAVGRGRLREILGARLGMAPAGLAFAYAENGKPSPVGGGVHFNLSHSGGLAALAIGDVELGVDVEEVRPLKEDVAGRFFSPAEVARLRALPESEQLAAFYRCWTRKEAVLKAVGEGLMRPLASFDVSLDEDAQVERMEGEANPRRDWRLVAFEPGAGFAGAVACRTGGADVALRRVAS